MSKAAGQVFSSLTRVILGRGICFQNASTSVSSKLQSVRTLAVSSQMLTKSKAPTEDEEEVNSEPIKFSTSKASHRTWKVDRSMGSQYERPWWKVIPISLFGTAFLLWCAFREETDIDEQLEKQLYEQFPSLVSDEETEDNK
ncbi:unnamed protein product [Menidia menidia]|uniref:(Atlantic silverside) hypothetical protein n=1 Tax=Menidia menidia TaxID=238744 RepID=A0A8S4B870_9TELE|nr:unnamed protein product [Menidia menidia]